MDGVRVGSGLEGDNPKKLPLFPRLRNFSPLLLFCLHSEPRLIRLAEKPLSLILRPSLLFLSIFLSPLPRPSAAGSFPLHPGKELLELLTRNEVQQRTTTGFFYSSSLLHPSIWVESGQKKAEATEGSVRKDGPPYCVHKASRDSGSLCSATFNLGRRRASSLAVVSFKFFLCRRTIFLPGRFLPTDLVAAAAI